MRSVILSFVAVVAVACGSAPARAPSQLIASDVIEVAAPPPGYEAGDELSESCSGRRGFRVIQDEALSDVDCGVERLSRALRARAAEQGSPYLIEKSCRARGAERVRVSCVGRVAVPTSSVGLATPALRDVRPAPAPAQVHDLDEPRPQDSAQIRVSFVPRDAARIGSRRPRAYDRVAETAEPAVGRAELGQVSARCPSCEPSALHHALRVTAGRVGAGEVSDVRCFTEDHDRRCLATALEPWSY